MEPRLHMQHIRDETKRTDSKRSTRGVGTLAGDEVRRRCARALGELGPRGRAERGKRYGEREELTTTTAMCSAGPVVDGVDGDESRIGMGAGDEEEEEDDGEEAFGSA